MENDQCVLLIMDVKTNDRKDFIQWLDACNATKDEIANLWLELNEKGSCTFTNPTLMVTALCNAHRNQF